MTVSKMFTGLAVAASNSKIEQFAEQSNIMYIYIFY